ncbi:HvfC/BufC N-terminal domain-containing protein, partial [Klebsiella aerogenes]|uniref:HvfC/BufC N-terminal domain-containing protein n=1 Tax=Klebsiella aerogenes TaxID=548 RepID=UPI0013D2ACBE
AGDAGPGLQVYRHAYRARLAEALADNYTVLARALGDEAFDALAQAYLAAHPSRHPSIRWFGAALADFMAVAGDELVPHPGLVDLARMD